MRQSREQSPPEQSSRAEPIGVVLAGGASQRMGRDKARLRLGTTSLVEQAAAKLREVVSTVLVADRGRGLVVGCRSVPDGPGGGPAAGILGAAAVHPGRDLLILACDLPAVSVDLLRHLALAEDNEAAEGTDAFVPRWDRGLEPLCALYRPAALDALASQVAAGRFALHSLLSSKLAQLRCLEGSQLAAFGAAERLFSNLNTPEDLDRLLRTSLARPAPPKID